MNWDAEVDFISVGSGAGGLCAAIRAAHGGLKALILEKSERLGGVTAQSGGQLWLGLGTQTLDPDSPEEVTAYVDALSVGFGDARARALNVRRAAESLQYYIDKAGLRMEAVPGLPDYYYPLVSGSKSQGRTYEPVPVLQAEIPLADKIARSYTTFSTSDDRLAMCRGEEIADRIRRRTEEGLFCAGTALSAYLLKAALGCGVEIRGCARVIDLIQDNGRAAGVVVDEHGTKRRIGARRGILLATGGYDWNPDLVKASDHLYEIEPISLETIEGDFIALAGMMGAAFYHTRAPERMFGCRQAVLSGLYEFAVPATGFPHAIVVNSEGRRFCDESFAQDARQRLPNIDGSRLRLRNWPAWMIFDQRHVEQYGFAGLPKGVTPPVSVAHQAMTLRDLAASLGVDGLGLEAEVGRFNRFAEAGLDEDFGRGQFDYCRVFCGDMRHRPNPNLGPIANPPFYGAPLVRMGTGFTTTGLVIDDDARVINVRGQPIEGLYAAGNSVGYADFPVGYNSGIANMRGMMHGYLAAVHAGR